jgi:aryl-alcohol dehydrogenase-like predicted oxidoreductase
MSPACQQLEVSMRSLFDARASRRDIMTGGLAAGVGLALGSFAASGADGASSLPPITKMIPSSGEKLPVIGLGTNQYSVTAAEELAARKEVLLNMPKLGGRLVDTARSYGEAEVVIGQLVKELGNRDQLFLATKTPLRGDLSQPAAVVEESFKRLQVDRIDLLQIHSFYGLNELFPALREFKQAKKVRYIGVTTWTDGQYPQLKQAIAKLPLDFIQVDYSIDNRGAGDEILPMAKDKGIAVLINVPLGGRRGSVLSRLAGKPLPPWASDVDATSWAQLLLKYNISHSAVTAVIPGTTKLAHLEDNQRAGRGRLPDAAMRRKIEEFWSTL